MVKKIMKSKILMCVMLLMTFVLSISTVTAEAKAFESNIAYNYDSGNDDSGGDVVDGAMDRGDKLATKVIKFIGKWMAIISFIFCVISFPTNNHEMRNISVIGLIISGGLFFGPEIVGYILTGEW